MARVVVLSLLLLACGSGPRRVGDAPSWRGAQPLTTTAAAPAVFAPEAPAVAMYNRQGAAPPSTPLGDAVVKAVKDAARTAGIDAPFADARLFRACEELAQIVPEQGVVAYRVVEFVMQRNGLIEPSPHLLVVWGDLSDPALIVEQLAPRFADIFATGATARVGIGAAKRTDDGAGAVVFALQASAVSTNAIPRALREGERFRIEGSVRRPYREPEVLITSEDGQTRRLPLLVGAKSSDFAVEISCQNRSGRQQLEINASDVTGATVLANFPIWCGEAPPTAIHIDAADADPVPATAAEAAQRLLALVNRDRRKAGLPELEWNEAVAGVARGHSEEMRRTQVVAHISPTTGSASDRIRAAGLKSPVVLENVARAYGVSEAHAGLMDSPGHRQNLLSPLATHVGIGVVLGELVSGRPEMFVTQVFTRVNRLVDLRAAAAALQEPLSTKRRIARAAPLEHVAQRVAEALAKGIAREQAWKQVNAEVNALGKQYKKIDSVITAVTDVSTADPAALLVGTADQVGIGVAQGPHPKLGDGARWIVLLIGEAVAK
jgi:uncharacterized protein YkwD